MQHKKSYKLFFLLLLLVFILPDIASPLSLPDRCNFPPTFDCVSFGYDDRTQTVQVTVTHWNQPLTAFNLSILDETCTSEVTPASVDIWEPEEHVTFSFVCDYTEERYTTGISFEWYSHYKGETSVKEVRGEIYGRTDERLYVMDRYKKEPRSLFIPLLMIPLVIALLYFFWRIYRKLLKKSR